MTVTFDLLAGDDPVGPRAGILHTPHGEIQTPAFMPVGTLATVKTLAPAEVREAGVEILLCNAYHLYLRPGHELIERLGGVHRFMDWELPLLSDSGGFQVFSLARISRVDESGVRFRSHIDGSEHHYTPELAVEVQRALGVDVAMPLDHVLPGDASDREARDAVERTLRWYDRCRQVAGATALFPIVQGGVSPELRRFHAREVARLESPGIAIGGLSVGESKADQWAMTAIVNAELPSDRPRYLMGVGSPEDLVHGVALGVDMFDCVLPTRLGRNGGIFTDNGRVSIRGARFKEMDGPIDPGCDCPACVRYSAAYLHHLFRNDEIYGYRLASLHNVRYLTRLTQRMREATLDRRFAEFAEEYLGRFQPADQAVRAEQRKLWEAAQARADIISRGRS